MEQSNKTPLERLEEESETINPAIVLADKLMKRSPADLLSIEEVKEAEKVLEVGAKEIETIERHRAALLRSLPSFSSVIPTGF